MHAVFDPDWLLNPAKVFPLDGRLAADAVVRASDSLTSRAVIGRRSGQRAAGLDGAPGRELEPRSRSGRTPAPSSTMRSAARYSSGGGTKAASAGRCRLQRDAVDRRAHRHHALRAGRAGDRRAPARRSPRSRRRSAARARCCPSSRWTTAPLLGSDRRADDRRRGGRQRLRPAPHHGGRRRDSLIGVRFVNGRGEVVKTGGRVMKNVTGLDLVKLMAGSWGTLGVADRGHLQGAAEAGERRDAGARRARRRARRRGACAPALGSPYEVTGAAHLPAALDGGCARTLLRIEGFAASVAYRLGELTAAAEALRRGGGRSRATLPRRSGGRVRDAASLAEPRDRAVWRVSVAPTEGPAVLAQGRARLERRAGSTTGAAGWSGSRRRRGGDAGAAAIRAAVRTAGGHATLVRAPASVRAAVDVFEPLGAAVRLTAGSRRRSIRPASSTPGGCMRGLTASFRQRAEGDPADRTLGRMSRARSAG